MKICIYPFSHSRVWLPLIRIDRRFNGHIKYFLCFLSLIFISVLNVLAQNWETKASTTSQHLYGISFITESVGFAVGNSGTMLKTSNGGLSWVGQTTPTTNHLKGISFVSESTGTVVGWGNVILRTTNGGSNWQSQSLPSGSPYIDFYGVSFISSEIGTIVGSGGHIYRTTDGGTTWVDQTDNDVTSQALHAVSMSGSDNIIAAGKSGTIVYSSDGGASWTKATSGTTHNLYGVSFLGAYATVVGDINSTTQKGTILRSENYGATWNVQAAHISGRDLYAVSFSDQCRGMAVGTLGAIHYTEDGGENWMIENSAITNQLSGISLIEGKAIAVGISGTTLRRKQLGTNWVYQKYEPNANPMIYLKSVSFTDENNGITAGEDGKIYYTNDRGTTWNTTSSGTTADLFSVALNGAYGFAVGDGVGGGNSTILRTTNSGVNWTSQNSGTVWSLYGVTMIDANKGTAVGGWGTILRTTNGGSSWSSQTSGTTQNLNAVSFSGSDTGMAVGNSGTILKTTNGGVTWASISSGTSQNLSGVSVISGLYATVVGENGTIRRTTDGGSSWVAQSSQTTNKLRDVSFTDNNNGTVVGWNGVILRTSDGGSNWDLRTSGTNEYLEGVIFTDVNNGTLVGAYTSIHRAATEPTSCITALPVELMYFKASEEGEEVRIQWATASEVNNDFFEVQKSINGLDFRLLTTLPGAGNSLRQTFYEARDNELARGPNYYRLRQVDFDGTHEYSTIVIVFRKSKNELLTSVFPNPGKEDVTLQINSPLTGITRISLVNIHGQQVLYKTVFLNRGLNIQTLSVTSLERGLYILECDISGEVSYQKVMVEK